MPNKWPHADELMQLISCLAWSSKDSLSQKANSIQLLSTSHHLPDIDCREHQKDEEGFSTPAKLFSHPGVY